MKKKYSLFITLFLILLVFLFLLPLYWLFISSVKSSYEIGLTSPTLWPREWMWSNYRIVWNQLNLAGAFLNSFLVSISTTTGIVFLCSLLGYVLAKSRIVGRKIIFASIVGTMIVPPAVIMLPLFFMITKIGLYDQLSGIIFPFMVTAFGVFFMKQYIEDVPNELIEAGRMDGLNEWDIFFRLIFVNIIPANVTLGIIELVNNWNAFIMPLILLNSNNKFTIPLKLSEIATSSDIPSFSLVLAANVLAISPILIIFVSSSQFFTKGVIEGAVKG